MTSVTCHALTPPTLETGGNGVFHRSTTKIPNLYVPEESLSNYKNSAWADFFTDISAIPTTSGPFTIRFIADSELIKTETLNYGASISAPSVTSKEYHTFSWNDLPETMPARNVTVYGYNYPNTYYISYIVDGSLYKTVGYKYGYNVNPPANPTKEGYTFTGWDPALPNLMPGKNLTVDASFEVNKYTLTYQVDGFQYGDVKTYEYGATITPVTAPTKAGHTFSGWQGLPTEMPAQNTIVTGSFTANTYTVTYKVDDTEYAVQTYTYGSSVQAPAENPTKTGYIFTGWKDLPSTMSDKNVTVMGSFIPACGENVGWTFVNGTLTITGTGTMYDYENETDVPWYSSRESITTVKIESGITDIGKYAFWGCKNLTSLTLPSTGLQRIGAAAFYKCAFTSINIPEGVTHIDDAAFRYCESLTTVTIPSTVKFVGEAAFNECHKLSSFTSKAETAPQFMTIVSGSNFTNAFLNIDANAKLIYPSGSDYSSWLPYFKGNKFTLTYKVGDTTTGTQQYACGETITPLANPTQTGYTFAGWTNLPSTMPAKNITVTGSFSINQYTITFDTDGGSAISAIKQNYGTSVTKPANPTKTGYTFAGWDKEIPANMPAGDMTITAQWKVNQYTITFDTDGGSEMAAITQNYGTAVTAPADPTKTGYTFAGWDKEIPATMPAENVTVNAKWTVNQYTITFNTDGGSEITAITQDYGTAVTAPANPTKEGYTFTSWDKQIPETMPAEDMTITALWAIGKYSITFDTDGGTAVNPIVQDYGTAITAPTAPTKEGYTFAGWIPEVPETMPERGLAVKAQWTVNQYTITFDVDGGTAVDPITQDYNTTVTAPADPTKTGYTFAGWDTEVPSTMPAEDMTIKATWTINQYSITFDTDGGTEIAPIKADYGTAVTAPATPTKTGYTFAGWDKEIPATMPAEDVTIKAQWTVNQYTITFNTDGGSEIAAITLDFGTDVNAPADPTKTGYTFAGWDVEIPTAMPAKDVTIKAQWTVNQYTITFNTDGGSEIAAITLDFGTDVNAPADPTKTGYTFAGWDKTVPTTMPAENVTITAQWTINQYTITFDTDGGTAIEAITQDYNTAITAPADPTKTGYTFAGWSPALPETMPAENRTVKATWTINQYTITFNTDGGSTVDPITQDYNTAVTAPADPTKEGYTFAGWDNAVPSTMPAENVTITAQWTANQYTITFDVDGGTAVASITQDYNTAITAPADPTKTGYTFAGWSPALPETMPAENVTVKATWTINQYTITFNTDGGSTVDPITQDYSTAVTAPADPTKEGYTFAGWDSEIPTTMPAENVTITAQWTYTPTIEDGKEYTATENMEAATLTYTRTLPNTGWNALYVPFEIPVSMLSNYEVAYMNDVRSYDMDDDGVIDDMSMEIIKIKSGTLNANYPYLIKAKNESAQKMEIWLTNVMVYAATETTVDCSSVIATFAIKGTYKKIDGMNLNGCYALSGGIWKPVASDSYLNPSRIYLTVTEREGSPVKVSTETMQRVRIHVKGEENTTSVEEKLLMDQSKEDIIYDLMGRRVLEPQKSRIYIVNGKKIVF